jgi:hypothetical protein
VYRGGGYTHATQYVRFAWEGIYIKEEGSKEPRHPPKGLTRHAMQDARPQLDLASGTTDTPPDGLARTASAASTPTVRPLARFLPSILQDKELQDTT